MAKKHKGGKEWWQKYRESFSEKFKYDLESDQPKKAPKRKISDEDGVEITDYLDEENYSSYDYSFKQSFKKPESKDWDKDWNNYQKSGEWKGYTQYRAATLSYKYIQQIANTIASRGNVQIEVGNTWSSDIKSRKLTYNPTSLMYGTKGELMATLLHEVGKISNSTPQDKLESVFLKLYENPAYLAMSVFEDMRIDMLMLKEYSAAAEVYESNTDVVERVAQEHLERGKMVRAMLIKEAHVIYSEMVEHVQKHIQRNTGAGIDQLMKEYIKSVSLSNFGKPFDSLDDVKAHVNEYITKQETEPMLDEYIADMLRVAYGIEKMLPSEKCANYTDRTAPKMDEASQLPDTQSVISMMDREVYPVIERLLKQPKNGTEAAEEFFGPGMAQAMMNNANQQMQAFDAKQGGNPGEVDPNGNMKPRLPGGGRGKEALPKEWADGNYPALKESVEYEIRQLTARLNFIRREENTVNFIGNQRRGKLDMKKLYRHASGNWRIFKKKLDKRDTIQSFGFSLYVDISGSMRGNRIINATRGLIVFAEVFNRFNIPFEILCFDGGTKKIKGFEEEYDKPMRNKVGGITQMANGGTTLGQALDQIGILKRPEANKIVVILSDGDTEQHLMLDEKYFIPWEKKGVKSMGIGIETGNSIKSLCHGNGIAVDNSSKLPTVFSDLLKKLIKRK